MPRAFRRSWRRIQPVRSLSKTTKFLLVLVVGLALVTWVGADIVQQTTREWFDKDIALRVRLVGNSAALALGDALLRGSNQGAERLLEDIARDERIMAAAICGARGEMLAETGYFPSDLSCPQIGDRINSRPEPPSDHASIWESNWSLPGGDVHVAAIPIIRNGTRLGWLSLVHDLSFIDRREAKTRRFLFLAFGILALSASMVTFIAARLSWAGFRHEIRRFILGKAHDNRIGPVVHDLRELVEKVVAESDHEGQSRIWSPQRLKQALVRYFPGEKVIVLANREPYIHQRHEDGKIHVMRPASGLVTAVEPVLRACSGIWVAHGGGSADRETVDRHDRVCVPPGEESYSLRRVWLSEPEELGYYYGFSNQGLWPLCHLADARPIFHSSDWSAYEQVNRRFAAAVCDESSGEDPIVLVQDYHFALAPKFIREALPRAVIISFWHIPWPNAERFGICPWHTEILEGLLGSSIVGFHTQLHCNNFLDSAARYLEARIDREGTAVVQRGRASLVRPYPISIDWPNSWAEHSPPVDQCREQVRAELGLPPGTLLAIGVDRLDYTKGLEERFLAVERLLERRSDLVGRFCFVQLAAPSRSAIERYQQLDAAVEALAKRINTRFARQDWRPIILHRAHHEPPVVFRYYRGADLCYVSSLHDGMNLVAKEFVASRDDEKGVLVLSRFTGAASELPEALIVNPYDLEEASTAMERALTMPEDEQRDRMRAMRTQIAESNVYRWAGRMLVDAARLRRRANVLGRLEPDIARLANITR
jgi:trehalose 6-phosphate synthase